MIARYQSFFILSGLLFLFLSAQDLRAETLYDDAVIPKNEQVYLENFARGVLDKTTAFWTPVFEQHQITYNAPNMVFFAQRIDTPCGTGTEADGPFYCPNDRTIYVDLKYLYMFKTRKTAQDDFAPVYAIAHEAAHHVQNSWGILSALENLPQNIRDRDANDIPKNVELMADCLAGVWAAGQGSHLTNAVMTGGIEAAQQFGTGAKVFDVELDKTSHGSLAMRQKWFKRGYTTRDMKSCQTFPAQ
ncbi:MAG: neutral zinc metallopeptidase [Alphaproteobacteria bacterium]|nr:neutral zinc metallopeptidase [Alphaproteobacteria bacterium]